MEDTRLNNIRAGLREALDEFLNTVPNVKRIGALLDDCRTEIVDLVEENVGDRSSYTEDMNHLDAARQFLNRAISFLRKDWALSSAEQFTGHALTHVNMALSNVVPLRPNGFKPGGGAA